MDVLHAVAVEIINHQRAAVLQRHRPRIAEVGRGAVVAYRIAVDSRADNTEGRAVNNTGVNESGFNIVSAAECPQHIDGVTPNYELFEQPVQLALSPYQPVYDESSNYQSPVL